MKYGDYLRLKREKKSWTQPEAAAKAEIEQSYLSKLETGKSYPSEDIFNRLVEIYEIDTSDMSRQVFSAELDKLREIKEIRTVVLERQKSERSFVRGWLIAGLVLLMLGGGSFGLTRVSSQTPVQQFHYRSAGILLAGEPLTAFDIINDRLTTVANINPKFKSLLERQQDMIERIDEGSVTSTIYLGDSFVKKLAEGKRYYTLIDNRVVEQVSPLRWLLAPALMFLAGSLGCFFISFRWK